MINKVWMLLVALALAAGCATEPPKPEAQPAPPPAPVPAPKPPPPPEPKPRAPEPEKPKPAPEKPKPVAEKVTFAADVLFDFDKAVIKPEGKSKLDDISNKAKGVNLEVVIAIGHADSVGSDAYNQRLSVRRAESVKAYLVSKGIEANRVYTEGKGEKQPVAENKTADGRAKNRRVEIEVIGTRQSRKRANQLISFAPRNPAPAGFFVSRMAHGQRRSGRAGEIRQARAPLVGSRRRVPPAARDQPAAPGVDRAACAARRQQRAGCRLRRRHPRRGDGAPRRAGDRHRPVREGAARCRAASA